MNPTTPAVPVRSAEPTSKNSSSIVPFYQFKAATDFKTKEAEKKIKKLNAQKTATSSSNNENHKIKAKIDRLKEMITNCHQIEAKEKKRTSPA